MDPHTSKRSASAVEGMEEQRSTQKPKLDPAPDLWSEDEHRRLDKEILNACGVIPADSFEVGWALPDLLSEILEQIVTKTGIDSNLVGRGPTTALLRGNYTLVDMTVKAWREGSFKEIRNYGKCFLGFRLLYLFDGTHASAILRPKAPDRSYPVLETTASSSQQQGLVHSAASLNGGQSAPYSRYRSVMAMRFQGHGRRNLVRSFKKLPSLDSCIG
jgi:hypothetical protein